MNDIVAGLDLKTLGVIGLCLALGFAIVWTVLSAKSADQAGKRSEHPRERKDDPEA